MTAGERITSYLTALRTRLEAANLFRDIRNHLDLFDLEDVLKENFKCPAARVIFVSGRPEPNAGGGIDCPASIVIAVIARREGRPDPLFASADQAALTLAFDLISAVNRDPYFGQTKVAPATVRAVKVAVSEKTSKDGVAIVLIEFGMSFMSIADAYDPVKALLSGDTDGVVTVTAAGEIIAGGAQ